MTRVYLGNGRYRLFEEKLTPHPCKAVYTRADGSEISLSALHRITPEECAAAGLPCREFQEPEISDQVLHWVVQLRRNAIRLEEKKARLVEVLREQNELEFERMALVNEIEGRCGMGADEKELALLLSRTKDAEVTT